VDRDLSPALSDEGGLMSVLRERVTLVWLGLVVLTCVTTWGLSKNLFTPAVAVVGIFLIAAMKVRYVILDFMELRNAPIPVRVAFEAWPVVVAVMILGFWFATGAIA
jgi:heme/copper-type cytochrome/quinol oxidase subunit 4